MGSFIWNIRIRHIHIKFLKKGVRTNGFSIGRLNFSINKRYNSSWGFFQFFK